MAKRKYEVAVILINYNSSQYTLDCVNSIFEKTTGCHFQIIIIDNHSGIEDYNRLELLHSRKDIQVFRSKINTGFSGANMMGVQIASADYYYFLNNDCVLLDDCLGKLHFFLEQHSEVGNCSGEMFNAAMDYEPNFSYFPSLSLKLLGSGLLKLFHPQRFPDKRVRYSNPVKVDLVKGSSMFVRATAFEEIGGMDTTYFLYCEEEDMALRLSRKGYLTYLVPGAKYQHFVSKSTEKDKAINLVFLKEFYISFLYFYRKNYGVITCLAIQLLYFFKMVKKFYKNWDYVKLAFFILGGAHRKHSLRFIQKMDQDL